MYLFETAKYPGSRRYPLRRSGEMVGTFPDSLQKETELSFQISDRIYALMQEHGLSKKQFADALGKRPCEVTKWLSGQYNFTIDTLGALSSFLFSLLSQLANFRVPVGTLVVGADLDALTNARDKL